MTKRSGAKQLPLPLPSRSAAEAADFLVADNNRDAVRWLDLWPDWPDGGLLLHGPAASGKTHLAAIWAGRSEARRIAGQDLTEDLALDLRTAIAIDGIEQVPEPKTLFHAINTARARSLSFLLTARRPAAAWESGLPDLDSRIRALPSAGLQQPDDILLSALAAKLFADRQITVPDPVIAFMINRLERSCAAVADAVAQLDAAALAQRRTVNLGLAREVLKPTNEDE